jgi:hypothetical protein
VVKPNALIVGRVKARGEWSMRKIIVLVAIVCLVPTFVYGFSGYELYAQLKNYPDYTSSTQDMYEALQYFKGAVEGMHMVFYEIESEGIRLSGKSQKMAVLKTHKKLTINIPKESGLADQVMVFNKWAKDNPKSIRRVGAYCIYKALREAYNPQ